MAFNLDDFLLKSQQANASDVHLHCNRQPSLRIKGDIYKISSNPLTYEDIVAILKQTLPAAQTLTPMLPEIKVNKLLPQAEQGIIPFSKRTKPLPQAEQGIVPLFKRTKTISPITIEPGVQLISAVPKKPRSSWFRNFMNNAEVVTFAARKGCKLNKSKSK